jgi:hypothetical protein
VGHEEAPIRHSRDIRGLLVSPLHFLPAKLERTSFFHFQRGFAVGPKFDLLFISLTWDEESKNIHLLY